MNSQAQDDGVKRGRKESSARNLPVLPPPDIFDPVIELYKRDVDRTLLRENLKLTPSQRAEKFTKFVEEIASLRSAAIRFRTESR